MRQAEPAIHETETRLAEIWQEVFELPATPATPAIPVETDFFAMGGDSLRATQLVGRIAEVFGVELPLDCLFETPTLAGLAALIAAQGEPALPPAPPLVAGLGGHGGAPLAFAQRRLWFLHQLEPDNPVHNLAAAMRLDGALDAAALRRSLDTILRRHEALRTVFRAAGEEPVQEVVPAAALPLPAIDLAALPAAAQATAARTAATLLARRPFDLARGPLLRAALLVRGPGEHELVLAWHHIAADGWSLGVLLRELTALYPALARGRRPALPDLPLQVADFARWQRRWLRGAALAPLLEFWLRRLDGEPPPLELPADRPRPPVLSYRGAHHESVLAAPLAERLAVLGRDGGATPFMTLLAGFAALLHRATGEVDLVLGTPISGRHRRELAGLVGVFINNLVLRLDVAGDPSFRQLLRRVRETALAAYRHQELPFELLVDARGTARDLSRSPLFQVLFVEQPAPLAPIELPGLRLAPRELDLGTARFDLALAMAPWDSGWLCTWKYSTDLFDAPTPRRLAGQLGNLLAAAAAAPDLPLSRLAWLSEAERHQVLVAWNDTAATYRPSLDGACLHHLIAEQAARTPDAVAVSCGEAALTYRQLGERTARLARHLRGLGVGPEGLVGVAAERSLEMVVALVATLAAGGAYVPLDPDYPRERLRFMLEDAGIAVLLTQDRLAAALPPHRAPVVRLDDEASWEGGARADRAAPPVLPDHPAYAIYTSGSTGRPKGAAVSHRAIVNRLLWMQEAYRLGPDDRVLQKTPLSFDVSVWEVFWPLITGARLVVAPPGAHRDAAWLARILRDEAITTLHFVPSMLQLFLAGEEVEGACRSVRRVVASGEALSRELAERSFARLGAAALHNLYGPTEAAVDVSFHACRPGGGRRAVPIGRPIANLSLYVLDRQGDPVPAGVAGELHIGGVGLARGYLGRPELTAERFVPGRWCGPGGRLYRTGDLARFRADGEIEFLGRLDHQVKVRGVRIELGEIEAALARHPGVREAVAVAVREAAGEARLVAFLVPAAEPAPAAAELRAWLRESLPEAMVPAAFVPLPALPLTPSGKVDRRALPAPDFARPEREQPAALPRTPLETRLAAMWQELLRVERIGIHDSFFELGGDSIQGAMFVNRLQQELGQIVYVMALFDAPTVAGFAAYLESAYPEAAGRLGGGGERGARPAAARTAEPGAAAAPPAAGAPAAGPPAGVGALPLGAALETLHAAVLRRLARRQERPPAAPAALGERNPRAVFVLAPFRSGTTLFRVMLAGHPRLFAPPELELLAFATMGERAGAYGGRNSFALEGLLRAVMELRGGDAAAARAWVGELERDDLPVAEVYRRLQEASGGRLLVDKTPSYALDPETLRRAERIFDEPLYLHLVRHPRATIDSYVEARMDRVYEFPYPPEEQAELVWLASHRNILEALSGVPPERTCRLRFEDLVKAPRATMEAVCGFLGLPFEPAMLEPYEGRRMTDGLHAASRMMGDPKFLRHAGITAAVADRWQGARGELRPETRALGEQLGYPFEPVASGTAAPARAPAAAPAVATAPAPAPEPLAGMAPAPRPRPAAGAPEDAPPLSYPQERLWFLAQLDPANPSYNMPAALRITGRLDVACLARSFDEVRRRHEVLRTTFPTAGGRPAAVVHPAAPRRLPLIDLAALADERGRREMERLALEEGRRPFDMARGPMLRTTLLRLAGDGPAGGPAAGGGVHVLLLTLHHIVCDGWTIGILVAELAALYGSFSRRLPSPLPELPLQYADYAAWQRQWLDDRALAGPLAWWRRRLAGPLPALDMPLDRPRPAHQTFRGARRSRTLPRPATEELRQWSRRQGTTPFLALLAAFDALLHRHTAQDDLLLGIPIANRNRVEIEALVGCFLNMVVQRTDAAGNPTLGELLGRVSESFLASVPYQEVPFEKVVEAVHPERDLSRAPLFQVQFSLQNTPSAPLALPGLTLESLELHNRTTKFDFTVFLFDEPAGLRTVIEHNADLFDEASIDRLLGHWTTLLAGAPAAAGLRLGELPLLGPAEREQLLRVWNRPAPAAAVAGGDQGTASLSRRFEALARRQPRAPAVIHDLEQLTYGQLNERANRLARHLRSLGVGPEVPVGLCVERSADAIVGLLGILKAGGAYVPLDPAYPRERLAATLADALAGSRAPVLVTRERLAAELGAGDAVPAMAVVRLDADRDRLAALPAEDLAEGPAPHHAAYVIYTSGSTGRPKGVTVTHANVLRLLDATAPWFGFGPGDCWTMFHSHAFDFSVWEIWGALAWGGRLVIVPREATLSPAALHELLATEGVTVLNQTPSAFRQLARLDAAEAHLQLALRWVIFGGEALELAALAPWIARHGEDSPRLVNMYGITETTVHVTWRPLGAADLGRSGHAPLGAPIPDWTLHLLGPHGELVPVGVRGEIHVGGAGVARGYLGRPDLTAERFVPDPFAAEPGARLYRSGDLARRLPDGDLDYLGRIDHQVKVRGFRIELGEIEAALLRHPALRAAAVAARPAGEDGGGETRLVAYCVATAPAAPAAPAAPEITELRAHLRASLPEHMLPAAFVWLDALPLTPSGKLDRRALPAPEEVAPAGGEETAYAPPRTRVERRLAEAWREVLRLDRVGRTDDFFEMGGHSLLVTQLASRVRAAFAVELPMAAVFESPTLAGLATRIEALLPEEEEEEREEAAPDLRPLRPVPREGPLPLSFGQERLWFLDQLAPGSPLYNVPASLRLRGRLDVPALARTFQEIVRRHEALRTAFRVRDGAPAQVVAAAGEAALAVPLVDLRGLGGEAGRRRREELMAELAEREAQRPFELARAPLLRLQLLRLDAEDHVLLATLHHIVCDGWSLGVLLREVAALYPACRAGRPSPLPELPVQYADFAAWQRARLQGEVLEEELAFWREQLAGAEQAIDLPADRARPALQGFAGRHLRFTFPPRLTAGAQALARQHGATLFMALLAAFQVQLHRTTGRSDFLVGSPVAGRNRREIEDLIGFFVNALVLRARLQGDPTIEDLLGRVKETTLAAFARQDLPFEKLVQLPEVERDTSRSPLFQAFFVLQNAPAEEPALPGLKVSTLDAESGTSKFDLTLSMTETPAGLAGFLEYSTGLFDAATAERMLGHFRHLLDDLAGEPRRRISELSLLGAAERRQLVAAWNDTGAAIPALPCHRLFEARVRAAPAAPAIVCAGEALSYGELNRRANQLARHLRRLGVGPEVRTGIALERSPALAAALVGTLKSGGAYVPLDPAHPRERLALMLADARPAVLLTEERLRAALPAPAGCRIVCLDGAWDDGGLLAALPGDDLPPAGGAELPESLAYVIFTSGSTGRPKGVQIPHRALVNFLAAMARRPGLSADDVLAAVTTVSFDIAALELFLPLVTGARIALASREQAADGARLAALLAAAGATALQATPAGWRMLLDAGWQGDPRLLALCGGEAVTPELAERLLPRVGSLWNVYGPTETTVWSAAGRVESAGGGSARDAGGPGGHRAALPVGPPLANTTLLVLDPAGEPAPVGVTGELYIGGAGLARGYLDAPELTASRFVPDPFARGGGGARLYRTGDLARRRLDGRIDFLGRADRQLKIRGFRIEPGEIAAVLGRHPAVRQAVVTALPGAGGDPRLVAYLVAGDPPPPAPELRAFLADRLPAYMLPADFVALAALPLTPAGKVDLRALPAPAAGGGPEPRTVPPETPTEELLAAIWEEVLERAPISTHDDFFALGGHSLLAPRILSRVESAFHVRLSLRAFFAAPTIARMAAEIDLVLLEEIEALSEEEAEVLAENG
jgi:amino acid adenylation domain-containing protein